MDFITLSMAKSYTNEQISKAQFGGVTTDPSLSKANAAADAKAVGEALSKKPDESRVSELITEALAAIPFAEEEVF